MKFSTQSIAILALSGLTSASPRKRQSSCIVPTVMNPDQAQAKTSIGQWLVDVENVNNFLNQAPTLIANNDITDIQSEATSATTNAMDEPCQLMTLASQSNLVAIQPAFACAVQDLMNVFEAHVLVPLGRITASDATIPIIQAAVDEINAFRCCNVLPDVDILFINSAENQGLVGQVTTSVPLEDACSNITCTPTCSTEQGANGLTSVAPSATLTTSAVPSATA